MAEHFVIAGAQRSGTSYLYALLDQHPVIRMARPLRPEPKYFLASDAVEGGYHRYLARCFGNECAAEWLGEKSTSYLERTDAIERVVRVLPATRLIFVLREPAARAFSNWRFSRDHGIEPLEFGAALDAEPERLARWERKGYSVCPYAYASRGHYARQLDPWLAAFPRERMRVMTSEALFGEPDTLAGLLAWLGLVPDVPIKRPGSRNASRAADAADEVLAMLRPRYAEDRARLANEWQLDTSVWPT